MKPLDVEMRSQVLSDIRRHARGQMETEVCGVLIGNLSAGRTVVEASIQGESARQAGTHVTFTQDTWTHIFEVKDARYPDSRIVGWYHSHPGFGIFLSDHDTFIHENFFSDPGQIAWVYDPKSEEEGCFVWQAGALVRIASFSMRDDARAVAAPQQAASEPAADGGASVPAALAVAAEPERRRSLNSWAALVFSHLLLLLIGAVVGAFLFPVVFVVPSGGEAARPGLSSPAPNGVNNGTRSR